MLNININSKFYADQKVLERIKIDAKRGEIISIIGPSGCGKSTLLKLVASLENDYKGEVTFKGLNSIENLGFIFQDSRLLPWLSVKENILLVSKNKDEKLIEELLIEVGLKDCINSYIKELSGGMKRRVSIIRAFINHPEVLLLDEPFISLDYPTAQGLRKLLLKLYEQNRANMLLVTHDLNEALAVSDRIIFLSANPASIIYEYKNPNRSFEEKSIDIKKLDILEKYPNILSGSLL